MNFRFGHTVRLPLPFYGAWVHNRGVPGSERRSGGHQDVVNASAGITARTQFNARGINTFFLREILLDIERALCGGIRCLIGRVLDR